MIEVMRGNNVININNKEQSNWNKVSYAILIAASLLINKPTQATTQKNKDNIKSIVELNYTTNLLNKMNQKFGISLPKQYNENLQNFISNSATLHNEAAAKFTENFISEQMSQDRGISKENQYLFIRCAIYSTLTNGELYDGTDGNEQRYNEYEIAFDYFLNCEENYKTKLKELMEHEQQRAKENEQRAKENEQRAKNEVMRTDTIGLQEITNYYLKYTQNPNLATQEEVNHVKSIAQDIVQSCKKYGIDYKQLLSPEVRKFYGIE